ncbi:MAG: Adenylate cyclase, partial [Micavibrio sp.]|nr:Adenylate cyclase [Micavibrio sp.]
MRNMLNSRWVHTALLLALLGGAVVVRVHDYEWSRSLRYLAFDSFNKLHPRQPTDQVAVVDLDEVSMGRDDLGQWPWPRNTVAAMVDRLKAMGARAIVFDMVFAESDRTSPVALLKSMPELKTDLAAVKDHDQQLADSFAAAGNVVAGFIWSPDKKATRRTPVLSKSILLSRDADNLRRSVPLMVGVTTTIRELGQAAAGNGCFGVSTEIDGLIRQVPLLFGFEADAAKAPELYPSLALEALRVSQDPRMNVKIRRLRSNEVGPLDAPYKMQVGQYEIPFDADGKFFVYFSKARTDKYIPAWQVFDGTVDPAKIKDKIILVGTSAEGLKDIRSTPLDLFIPGVEVHVNVIEQVLTGQ